MSGRTTWARLRVSLLFLMDWGSTATISAAEPGLDEWTNSPRSQNLGSSRKIGKTDFIFGKTWQMNQSSDTKGKNLERNREAKLTFAKEHGWSKQEEMTKFWTERKQNVEEDHTYRLSQAEYFHCRQNWWISLNKSGNTTEPLRKRSDFNQALSTLNRLHQEAGGQQLKPIPYWKYKAVETGIEFFLHLVAMERILVVFLRIQRKSKKRWQAKVCD